MKNVMKVMVLCFLSAIAVNANAAIVSAGDQLLVGGTLLTDTGALDTATTVQLAEETSSTSSHIIINTIDVVDGTGGTGGIGDVFGLLGNGGGAVSLTSFNSAEGAGFMSINGWTLDLTSLSVVGTPAADLLKLEGTGLLSDGAGDHAVTWALSAQSATSYSMDMTVVPVPAAVWLFGSGLIGLVGLARRKA
jgi:hypothetical protein